MFWGGESYDTFDPDECSASARARVSRPRIAATKDLLVTQGGVSGWGRPPPEDRSFVHRG